MLADEEGAEIWLSFRQPCDMGTGYEIGANVPEMRQRFSVITDNSLAQLRKLIGVPIEDTVEPWRYEATRDNVRHWAHGLGDDNPLWCDPATRRVPAMGESSRRHRSFFR